jgi:hypothetical protein
VIPNQVEAGRRHQRSELFNQLERFKNHVGCAVAPAALEAIQEPAAGQNRQALGSYRSAASIAAETLQPHTVMRGDADIGMNAECCNSPARETLIWSY